MAHDLCDPGTEVAADDKTVAPLPGDPRRFLHEVLRLAATDPGRSQHPQRPPVLGERRGECIGAQRLGSHRGSLPISGNRRRCCSSHRWPAPARQRLAAGGLVATGGLAALGGAARRRAARAAAVTGRGAAAERCQQCPGEERVEEDVHVRLTPIGVPTDVGSGAPACTREGIFRRCWPRRRSHRPQRRTARRTSASRATAQGNNTILPSA